MPANIATRIKAIQKQLQVVPTGAIDIATCNELEKRLNITVSGTQLGTHIKALQKALGIKDDGFVGPITISRIEAFILPTLPVIPTGASMIVSAGALNMLIRAEVTSEKAYTQKYQSPTWAGGDSGVTIGIGYDIGYCSKQNFAKDWSGLLNQKDIDLLSACCGIKGVASKAQIPRLKSVKIPYDIAIRVFYATTLPSCALDVRKIYPGVEKLPPDAQGALLSLVYNRGPLINNTDRRKEMKAIAPLVAKGDIKGIAAEIRSMKRLWDPKTQKGLIDRREQEASLTENATFNFLPEDIVIV